jgi:PAS domain S-box-containing protein
MTLRLQSAKRWFVGLSLAHKLTVLSTVTSAVSMTILCAILGWHDAATLRAHVVDDTEVLVSAIGANSTAALTFDDTAAGDETLRALAGHDQVLMAALLLRNGEILSRYERRPGRHPATPEFDRAQVLSGRAWHAFRDSTLAIATPIVFKGDVIGTTYIEVSLSHLRARTVTLWRTLAAALIGTVILAGLIAWRLQRIVSAPLLRLTQITRTVTRSRDYSIRAINEGDDEVGELVDGFNEMLEHIQRHDDVLKNHRLNLERTVNARTAELKASMERFKMLVESTHAVPWEIETRTSTFSYVSPQVTRLFGYEADALCDRVTLWDLVHPDDRARVKHLLLDLTRGGADVDFDCRVIAADQQVIDVRSVVSAHVGAGLESVVLRGITVDITQQKKLELELRQAQKLESVGRLASGVAHEINTPVQFVSDSVHFVRDAMRDLALVLDKYREGAPDAAETAADADLPYLLENVPKALDRSLEGLHRVTVIVRSMKEFAHPDQKEMTAVDLNQAINSTLVIARNEYKYVADVETDFGELPLVICHGGDVNQVILNLVVNAAHAIGDVVNGTDRRGRITVQTRCDGPSVSIRVGDTGGGIPDVIRGRIFDPFFTTKEVGKGTGQGLSIAHSVIVEKHGGDLTFETEVGRGTSFIIRLPVDGKKATVLGAAA